MFFDDTEPHDSVWLICIYKRMHLYFSSCMKSIKKAIQKLCIQTRNKLLIMQKREKRQNTLSKLKTFGLFITLFSLFIFCLEKRIPHYHFTPFDSRNKSWGKNQYEIVLMLCIDNCKVCSVFTTFVSISLKLLLFQF